MRALTWQGNHDVRVEDVPDPKIEQATDAIVKVTSSGICGSDLHLYEVLGAFVDPGDLAGRVCNPSARPRRWRGGTISLSGVYGGAASPLTGDEDPLGVEKYATHHLPLEQAPHATRSSKRRKTARSRSCSSPERRMPRRPAMRTRDHRRLRGVGRASALCFARAGASPVLAARAPAPPHFVAAECEPLGTEVLLVPTDVRNEGDVRALRDRERFGGFRAWVNDAGVISYGRTILAPRRSGLVWLSDPRGANAVEVAPARLVSAPRVGIEQQAAWR